MHSGSQNSKECDAESFYWKKRMCIKNVFKKTVTDSKLVFYFFYV